MIFNYYFPRLLFRQVVVLLFMILGAGILSAQTQLDELHCDEHVALSQRITAEVVAGVTQYEFLVENTGLSFSETLVTADEVLPLEDIPGLQAGITYQVRVRTFDGSSWSGFGTSCNIHLEVDLCGSDYFLREALDDPNTETGFNSALANIQAWINANPPSQTPSAFGDCQQVYTIPVVVHVVYDPAIPAGNISDPQIFSAIARLNKDFNGPNANSSTGANMCIQFCLAQVLPNGSSNWTSGTPGITRTSSSVHSHIVKGQNHPSPAAFFAREKYLNIWVVEELVGAAGFSTLGFLDNSGGADGIVIDRHYFGDNSDCTGCYPLLTPSWPGKTITHEAGHFLGLLHTFGVTGSPGCPSNGCTLDYDYICDTPPQEYPNWICNPQLQSCGTFDMVENYMNYTGDICRTTFTHGQRQFMFAVLNTIPNRAHLASMSNLIQTGVAVPGGCVEPLLTSEFTISQTQLCLGEQTVLSGIVPPGQPVNDPGYDFWEYTLSNGSQTFTSSGSYSEPLTTFVPPAPGAWSVSLTVSDDLYFPSTSTTSKVGVVFVNDCQPISSDQGSWYFGYRAGLEFSTGIGKSVSTSSHTSGVCAASVADAQSGALLFYTNGARVWDKTHSIMPVQGGGNLNGGINSPSYPGINGGDNSVVIVPDPGNANQYYVFTQSDEPTSTTPNPVNNGLSYSIVDMNPSTNGGFPDGRVVHLNQPVPGNFYRTWSPVAAIPDCGNTGYWIITHSIEPGTNDQLLAYHLTASGLQAPVLSNSFALQAWPPPSTGAGWGGVIEASPSGTRVAIHSTAVNHWPNNTEIYCFDRKTGEFFFEGSVTNGYATMSFSPSEEFLYGSLGYNLAQYDLRNLPMCQDIPVKYLNVGDFIAGLQVGPDNRIYVSEFAEQEMSIVNYPDLPLLGSNSNSIGFNSRCIPIVTNDPNAKVARLPNMIDCQANPPNFDFDYCITKCGDVQFRSYACGASYDWSLGDGTGSTERHPYHTYSGPGSYKVVLSVGGVSVTKYVDIVLPSVTITPDRSECIGDNVTYFTSNPSMAHEWSIVGNGTILGADDQPSVVVSWASSGGDLFLTITDPATGCSSTVSRNVRPGENPSLIMQGNADACNGTCSGVARVVATGGSQPYTYLWNDPAGQTAYMATGLCSGDYAVVVTEANGCSATANVNIPSGGNLDIEISSFSPESYQGAVDGEATVSVISGTQAYTYKWSTVPIQATATATGLAAGSYTVTVMDGADCAAIEEVTIFPGSAFVDIDPVSTICGSDPVFLTATPQGGLWSGTGIVNQLTGEFDPTVSGTGMFFVDYTYNYPSGPVTATVMIEVAGAGALTWPRQISGNQNEYVRAVATDGGSAFFAAGDYEGTQTVSFGNGVGVDGTIYNSFVTKYSDDNCGGAQWATSFADAYFSRITGLQVDQAGSVFVSGYWAFQLTVNGSPTFSDPDPFEVHQFVAKLSGADGSLIWIQQFETGTYTHAIGGLALDEINNKLYVACESVGDVTFGSTTYASIGTVDTDGFIGCFDLNGNPLFGKVFGSSGQDGIASLTIDASSNLVGTGYIGASIASFAGNSIPHQAVTDVVIFAYTSSGTELWARSFGSDLHGYGNDIAIDGAGKIYVTGSIGGSTDFGEQGSPIIVPTGVTDPTNAESAFVIRYDANTQATDWARVIVRVLAGGYSTPVPAWYDPHLAGTAIDIANGKVVVGGFHTTVVNPTEFQGFPNPNLVSATHEDAFVAVYGTDGTPDWYDRPVDSGIAGGYERITSIIADNSNNYFVGGWFGAYGNHIAELNLNATLTTTINPDGFFARINNGTYFKESQTDNLNTDIDVLAVIDFFPNPSSGDLYMRLNSDAREVIVTVVDALGKVVHKSKNVAGSEIVNRLDLSDTTSGIYFVLVDIGTQTITNRVIVLKD